MIALKPTGSTWRDAGDCDGINRAQLIEPRHVTSEGVVSLLRQRAAARLLRDLIVDDDHDTADVLEMLVRADEKRRLACNAAGIDLVLLKKVDPSVIETLLMLEGSRVNGEVTTGEAFVNAVQKN